jgi:hypothetical protein
LPEKLLLRRLPIESEQAKLFMHCGREVERLPAHTASVAFGLIACDSIRDGALERWNGFAHARRA